MFQGISVRGEVGIKDLNEQSGNEVTTIGRTIALHAADLSCFPVTPSGTLSTAKNDS